MTHASYYDPTLHGVLAPAADTGFLKALRAKFNNWRLTIETRRQLRSLPDYLLEDIGLTRYDIDNYNIRN